MAFTKGRVFKNTTTNTEKWIKIMNQWRNDIYYNYSLKSQDKDIIELKVIQFLCDITSKKSSYYSCALLKNTLSAISRHLNQDEKHEKKGIGKVKSTDGLSTDKI
ncbi:hypothetical protein GLOIN_2v1785178 [Rhizophagus irregularis DAOM 181602=DAOM 197198]|uniref:Uncharacterized protein n=1 Tax=Rhizophagus irregularis (strain DAOM 197198w) TaxID=1432141 RepID=A0A015LH56_RHIIW|nr:hypothetical protein RirG_073810 [Rhizophagus irregularis DAOM 197198w]GBC42189.1 hypothetical protein GLOIN_2v1785178 [Rhizophagus irregularis DAOM 181602=DAOM 197198]CAG8663332.1 16794_t:CDS:2 [Rhizophagus irregularis]